MARHKLVALISVLVASTLLVSASVRWQTFVSASEQYAINAPNSWISSPRASGTMYFDSNGVDRFEVLVFADSTMTQQLLLSSTTAQRLRENYHETYDVPEESVDIDVVGERLQVTYAPTQERLAETQRLSGSKLVASIIRERYFFRDGITYVIRYEAPDSEVERFVVSTFRTIR